MQALRQSNAAYLLGRRCRDVLSFPRPAAWAWEKSAAPNGCDVATVRVVVIDTLLLILGVALLVVALARLLVGGGRGVCARGGGGAARARAPSSDLRQINSAILKVPDAAPHGTVTLEYARIPAAEQFPWNLRCLTDPYTIGDL